MGRPTKHKVQIFNGISFYKKPPGYYKADHVKFGRAVYMHRYVWEFHNGPIAPGMHIHHKDHDRANNDIENLEMLSHAEHIAGHMKKCYTDPAFRERNREHLLHIQELAKPWHGSEEGRAWHSENSVAAWEKREYAPRTCTYCAKEFMARGVEKRGFCSMSCQGMARGKSGVDNVDRTCVCCGTVFQANKYEKTKTCSKPCTNVEMVATRAANKAAKRRTQD